MLCLGQTAFQNFGTIQLHNNAEIGFHTNLINNGTFNNNKGLAGFYSDDEVILVAGTNTPVFYDVEIDAYDDIELQVSLGITNELSFINGKILTDKNDLSVSLNFIKHNFYAGEDDERYVDGYSQVEGLNEFTFPIGDDDRIRPLILPEQNQSTTFKGAYFFEDPNSPTTFSDSFLTDKKQIFIENINTNEFWDLDGDTETTVTLTWDVFSNIPGITDNIENLRVVGWSSEINKWVDLGRTAVSGSVIKGKVTSNNFIPNNYEVITIGSNFSDGTLDNVNIIFTPNGDNTNETLVFEGLEQYDKNQLEVYNRWGILVYKAINYQNNWNGSSKGRTTVKAKSQLPVGTYFYILKFGNNNLSKKQKGWVYIHR
ncbi:MAG: gliding motility-associated C-terminal domain-containing protein [Tenacibaculum sp.]